MDLWNKLNKSKLNIVWMKVKHFDNWKEFEDEAPRQLQFVHVSESWMKKQQK